MDWLNEHLLTVLIFLPALAAMGLLLIPSDKRAVIFGVGIAISLLEVALALPLYFRFRNTGSFEFIEVAGWIDVWHVQYLVGIDGVSLLLVLLTVILTPLALLGSWSSVTDRVKGFVISMLILESGMVGVFCALDLFLFYVFWEVMLIPMYFIIGIWGGKNRVYAAIKFFLFTMAGSVLMLVAILYLYFQAGGTFNLIELAEHHLPFKPQLWVFLAFALAFAIKVPLFPFHTWLPDAHVEAPTAGSVILAGVLLKMGTYGFFRFAMPLFPEALVVARPYLMWLSVIGIVYGALVAMVQTDIKKLIAYSSVSHMGVVMLGLFSLERTGMLGGLYQMLSHGVSTGALFLLVGVLYERTHSRAIADHAGLAKLLPWYSTVFLIVTMSSIGVPLTNGFVGEFLSLAGTFQTAPGLAVIATSSVVLSAFYMLWMVQRVFFGELKVPETGHVIPDLKTHELVMFAPLIVFIVWMGVYPKPFLSRMERSVDQLLTQMQFSDENK